MNIVRGILKSKGYSVYHLSPSATVMDALREMADKGIGAILVMDADKLLGIFSERDYSRSVALEGKDENTPITDVMTEKIYCVNPSQTTDECLAQMTDKRIRHLPVVENGKVIGIISIGDLVKDIIRDQEVTIQSMENYILGRGYNQ